MELAFKNLVIPMDDCPREDESEPVLLELTTRGDLVFHNFDREAAESLLELGFGIESTPCLFIEEIWYKSLFNHNSIAYKDIFEAAAFHIQKELGDEAARAIKKSIQYSGNIVDTSTYSPVPAWTIENKTTKSSIITGLSGYENVAGVIRILNHFDLLTGRKESSKRLDVILHISIQSLIDVLKYIPSGLVRDDNKNIIVCSIEKFIDSDHLVVRAGRQLYDLTIKTEKAIIERYGSHRGRSKNKWRVKEWLY